MQLVTLALISSAMVHVTFAKVICDKSPSEPSEIPRLADCHELIEDIFAISKLEGDDQVHWSHNPGGGPGTRQLPYRFTAPSLNNDCEFLVDSLKGDQEDTFSVSDVGLRAREIAELCLQPKAGGIGTIGAEVVGPKRVMMVILLKRIPEPSGGGGLLGLLGGLNHTSVRSRLSLYGSSMYMALVKSSKS